LDGKALFTGMMRLYTATHREMEGSLLLECAQGKEEAEPRSKRRKSNSDSDDGISIRKREATEKYRPLPVYQKPRPVVTKNFFAPLKVPQDSVLALVLYSLYINDAPAAPGIHIALFAGDICVYATEKHERRVLNTLQHGLTAVGSWC
jgi:hypothetical protein